MPSRKTSTNAITIPEIMRTTLRVLDIAMCDSFYCFYEILADCEYEQGAEKVLPEGAQASVPIAGLRENKAGSNKAAVAADESGLRKDLMERPFLFCLFQKQPNSFYEILLGLSLSRSTGRDQ